MAGGSACAPSINCSLLASTSNAAPLATLSPAPRTPPPWPRCSGPKSPRCGAPATARGARGSR
eukprot:10043504-Alexandrium_andersonii.AAC.1